MKKEDSKQLTRLVPNGKSPVKAQFHRDGTISFRDEEGRWTHHATRVSPRIIMKLDRYTRARLWYRNFQLERSWAEAHA
jgi:hypothetical protein